MMRIAYIFIGITYDDKYISPIRQNESSTIVDFRETYNNVHDNLIKPYNNQGHIVDTYFVTYHSSIENELEKAYNPKKIIYTEMKTLTVKERSEKQINDRLNGLEKIKEYENENNFKYDFIIITRPDLYFFKNTTEIGIDYEHFNILFYHLNGTIFSGEDSWLGIPRSKVDFYIDRMKLLLRDLLNDVDDISTHFTGKYIIEGGEIVKYLYGEHDGGGEDYPFFKFIRFVRNHPNIKQLITTPMKRIYHCEEEYNTGRGIYIESIAQYRHQFKMFMKNF